MGCEGCEGRCAALSVGCSHCARPQEGAAYFLSAKKSTASQEAVTVSACECSNDGVLLSSPAGITQEVTAAACAKCHDPFAGELADKDHCVG